MRRIETLAVTRHRPHRLAVKLDDKTKSSLCYGFSLYFLRSARPSLFMAYKRTLAHFFAAGEETTGRSSAPLPAYPTYVQFKWFVTKIFGDPATAAVMYQPSAKRVAMVGGFSIN